MAAPAQWRISIAKEKSKKNPDGALTSNDGELGLSESEQQVRGFLRQLPAERVRRQLLSRDYAELVACMFRRLVVGRTLPGE